MVSYKKRGYKSRNKKQETKAEKTRSTTAEVFNTLDETASKSEKWIEKNSKSLFYGLIAIAIAILGYLGYNKYILAPNQKRASNELAYPKKYFKEAITSSGIVKDSLLNLGLQGANGKYGFLDIASEYSNTKSGNLANYYAGISYLKIKKYKQAIKYLNKFSSDDTLLGSVNLGAIGDAFSNMNQLNDALKYYEKATDKNPNNFTTPLFLFKAANTAMALKKYKKAEKLFTKIKERYPNSEQGTDIEKYINSAKYAED